MRLRTALTAATIAVTIAIPGTARAGGSQLTNPGFEADGGGTAAPAGWSEQGAQGASFTEAGGHTGAFRLTHWSAEAYEVVTSQRLRGLRDGTYTLRAWVRSSGDQRSTSLTFTNCHRGKPQRVDLPRTGPEWWVQIAVSTRVEKGSCTIAIHSDAVEIGTAIGTARATSLTHRSPGDRTDGRARDVGCPAAGPVVQRPK